jgi:hypothetical protein
MSRVKDNLQMYWPHAVGMFLFAFAVWRYVSIAQWEAYLKTFALAVFGFISVVASEEVASYSGRYGWTYDSFWTYPPTYIRSFGFFLLIVVDLFGFR